MGTSRKEKKNSSYLRLRKRREAQETESSLKELDLEFSYLEQDIELDRGETPAPVLLQCTMHGVLSTGLGPRKPDRSQSSPFCSHTARAKSMARREHSRACKRLAMAVLSPAGCPQGL